VEELREIHEMVTGFYSDLFSPMQVLAMMNSYSTCPLVSLLQ
jgi:hypothetical protein